MVVDDRKHGALTYAGRGLAGVVVVGEDHLAAALGHQVAAQQQPQVAPVGREHRQAGQVALAQPNLRLAQHIVWLHCCRLALDRLGHREALLQKRRAGERAVMAAQQQHAVGAGGVDEPVGEWGAAGHDQAARRRIQGGQL